MNPYKGTVTSEGTDKFPIKEFQASGQGIAYGDALEKALTALKQR